MSDQPRKVHTIIGGDVDDALRFGLSLIAKCGMVFVPIHTAKEVKRLQLEDCPDCKSADGRYQPHRLPIEPHFVYRCFGADGRLLYIGCSVAPKTRLDQHRLTSWWYEQVAETRVTVFPNRDYALWKEAQAIAAENPRWNIKGRDRSTWTPGDYADLMFLLRQKGAAESRVQKVREEARDRLDVDLDAIEVSA